MEISEVHLCLKDNGKRICNDHIPDCDSAFPFFENQIGKSTTERFCALFLDYDYYPIGCSIIGIGTANKVLIDPSELFKIALLLNARHFYIAHNHLGSSLTPTQSDIKSTQEIGFLGKLLSVDLIDSLILNSKNEYLSIRKYILEKGNE
ncbi:JAB domain-containing protein [Sporolactobacillus spathodeae]|uniref:DNA repair protein RadC n=1 Tax=Sporolactobacillus spathodeae TaxID=1465502 RepID=A0ABS2Q687_9BACL|nr:JAB domain-containing protein [Sporolactobacillus spathodeae]MBM7657238.1 DNA repair protein RadC [Sporolactobacillus spathodeae]